MIFCASSLGLVFYFTYLFLLSDFFLILFLCTYDTGMYGKLSRSREADVNLVKYLLAIALRASERTRICVSCYFLTSTLIYPTNYNLIDAIIPGLAPANSCCCRVLHTEIKISVLKVIPPVWHELVLPYVRKYSRIKQWWSGNEEFAAMGRRKEVVTGQLTATPELPKTANDRINIRTCVPPSMAADRM